jgi:hypothetical protein
MELQMTAALFSLALQVTTTPAPALNDGTHWGLKTAEWITIAAIVLGPIFAVVTQLWWQRYRQKRDQKLFVFGTLMSLRGASVSQDYVKALNFIDVVFYQNEKVREKWKTLLTYLSSDAYKAQPIVQATHERTRDLQAEILVEMAKDLGFGYDFTHIKENAYYPQALVTADNDAFNMRQKVIAALDGKGVLSVKLVEDVPAPAMHTPSALTIRGASDKKL